MVNGMGLMGKVGVENGYKCNSARWVSVRGGGQRSGYVGKF